MTKKNPSTKHQFEQLHVKNSFDVEFYQYAANVDEQNNFNNTITS